MPGSRSLSAERLYLSDGRGLAFAMTGPADGVPVIYCHGAIGTPVGSSLDLAHVCSRVGVRYISVMRPGIAGSDPAPGRDVLSFAADIGELADALALERFGVIGVSAGGPYALAIAHRLGDRVSHSAVVSSLSPLCAPSRTPGLRRRVRYPLRLLDRAPGSVCRVANTVLPLARAYPGEIGVAAQSFLDACAGGVGGLLEDYRISTAPWHFDVGDIPGPVDVWHGGCDPLVPVEHAIALGAALPHSRVFIDPTEGHHFFRANLEHILETLTGGVIDFRLRPAALPGRDAQVASLPAVRRAGRRAAA